MAYFQRFLLLIILGATLACGCARTSPAVGIWTGTIKIEPPKNAGMMGMAAMMLAPSLNGPCQLMLKADGTGFLKVSIAPEAPITWTEEDGKVIIRKRFDDKPASGKDQADKPDNGTLVGTLAANGQTLALDFGITKVELKKQNAGK